MPPPRMSPPPVPPPVPPPAASIPTPEVSAGDLSEFERAEHVLEVVVSWGPHNVLHASYLAPGQGFAVGESGPGLPEVDYLVGSDVLGTDVLPVVSVLSGAPVLVIPDGATGETRVAGVCKTFETLAAEELLEPCAELPAAMQYPLQQDASATLTHAGLVFSVRCVPAGVAVGTKPSVDWRPWRYLGIALGLHALFLVLLMLVPPRSSALSMDAIDGTEEWVRVTIEAKEQALELSPSQLPGAAAGGELGERAPEAAGQAGRPNAPSSDRRMAVRGRDQRNLPRAAVAAAERSLTSLQTLGVLGQAVGVFDGPSSPFGAERAYGRDEMDAMGALLGAEPGANLGLGGLAPRGPGVGGGGTRPGAIGVGRIATVGPLGRGPGYGQTGTLGTHRARGPKVIQGVAKSIGGLSKDAIRRVVRRNLNQIKSCYEQQLLRAPDLAGRVVIHFLVTPSGAVQTANVVESTLQNRSAETCIASAVRRWSFAATGQLTAVTYPFLLAPSGV